MPDTANGHATALNVGEPGHGPVTPTDLMIVKFKKWLDELETRLDQADKRADVPSDIPRFYTRYR